MLERNLSVEDKIYVLRRTEAGMSVSEVCRRAEIDVVTYLDWKKTYHGLSERESHELARLKAPGNRVFRFIRHVIGRIGRGSQRHVTEGAGARRTRRMHREPARGPASEPAEERSDRMRFNYR